MDSEDFEKQFEKFMKSVDYKAANEALFHVTRAAFMAGWLAASRPRASQRTAAVRKGKRRETEEK